LTTTEQNILKTLGYFDLFHYPLTREEIYLFNADKVSVKDIDVALQLLLADTTIFKLDNFYSLHNDTALVKRRCEGNLLAIKQMQAAKRSARWLSKFPYVKGIAVSGSLSKNFADEKSDIDFFIITTANRLWVARTLMHLYKKFTFLTGRQHLFCMNYFVDEAALEIPEKNIFTAMEIVTLVPMYGKKSLCNFINANNWTKAYFPVHSTTLASTPEIKAGLGRRLTEKILNWRFGNKVDNLLMTITGKRWKKKTKQLQLNSRGIIMGMLPGKHFSKPDPVNFQDKVVQRYEVKIKQLLQQQDRIHTAVV
jgi:hypothetical protein